MWIHEKWKFISFCWVKKGAWWKVYGNRNRGNTAKCNLLYLGDNDASDLFLILLKFFPADSDAILVSTQRSICNYFVMGRRE